MLLDYLRISIRYYLDRIIISPSCLSRKITNYPPRQEKFKLRNGFEIE